MFRKFFGLGGASSPSGTYYKPYRDDTANRIYNLLFCDNASLFTNGLDTPPLKDVLSGAGDRETLEKIGNDLDAESRVRVLAFNRLRGMKVSVPAKKLLGVIFEVPLDMGLDVLAVFADKSLRYINQTGKLAFFEPAPPALHEKIDEVFRTSQVIVNNTTPWTEQRRPPPKGAINRMTFLVSDGLHFGEGPFANMMQDRMGAPVMKAGGELLQMVVKVALSEGKPIA